MRESLSKVHEIETDFCVLLLSLPTRGGWIEIGQLEVPFTVTFTALDAVTNPKIIDAMNNNYLLVKKSMVAGERLVVEITHDRVYVTSSVDGECRGALDIKSKFYRLRVGDNVIKPEADSGKNNLSVSIDYAIEKTGVVL